MRALREGQMLYLLPDMDLGPQESIFVPFFGIPTATVPSLPRFAKLGGARVVPVVTRLTPDGYEVRVHPAWQDYPGNDVAADTARMNAELQAWIDTMPEQYYWVHKRFKTRPEGSRRCIEALDGSRARHICASSYLCCSFLGHARFDDNIRQAVVNAFIVCSRTTAMALLD
ncbi:hypothetical protein ACFSTJ_20645 [Ottowia pentelensis]|uniref:LpxL/LpxP family acyltransferase n=1 Tax=Ottowia pentelensis TaxID=511108 RepID=UPI0036286B9E